MTIGIETRASSEGAHLSFYKMSPEQMNEQLRLVEQAYENKKSFHRIAIHSLDGLRELVQ